MFLYFFNNLFQRGDVYVKELEDVWEELILHAESILGYLIKILLSWDQAHLCIIENTLDAFLSTVNLVTTETLKQLSATFEVKVLNLLVKIYCKFQFEFYYFLLLLKNCHNFMQLCVLT